MKKVNVLKKEIVFNRIVLSLMLFATIVCLISCNRKPNERLKIEGKKHTISIGEIKYNTEYPGVVTIEVLADGKPFQNKTTYRESGISIDGRQVSSSVSSSQSVTLQLIVNGFLMPSETSSNEDGIFTCFIGLDGEIEKISVKTGSSVDEGVYFDGKTKEIISADAFYQGSRLKQW